MDNINFGLDEDLINAVRGIVSEKKLHPNQKPLDKNKNGKLDAQDFKMLRKEEEEVVEEEQIDEAANTDIEAVRAKYKENEDENRHTENAELLAKHFGSKSDQNKAAKAKAYRDKHRGYGADPEGRSHSKMAYEVHSKLYHHIKEDVEQIDELSKATLGSYVKNAAKDVEHFGGDKRELEHNFDASNAEPDSPEGEMHASTMKTLNKRHKGINTAVKKLTKEQVEEIEALAAKHGLTEE